MMTGGIPWPKVSIITPSYNQGQFIEETMRSVLLQGYPNLEYIVIDGGSTDKSVEIIRRYEKWLAYWVSEKDRGQVHALNKGFVNTHGSILAYINSDDLYEPGAVAKAVEALSSSRETGLVYGDCWWIDENGKRTGIWRSQTYDLKTYLTKWYIPQPTAFWARSTLEKAGLFDERFNYALDVEMWLRMARQSRFQYLPVTLAQARICEGTKSASHGEKFYPELIMALREFFCDPALDTEVLGQRNRVLAGLNLVAGLKYVAKGNLDEGQKCLKVATAEDPDLLRQRAEMAMSVAREASRLEKSKVEPFVLASLAILCAGTKTGDVLRQTLAQTYRQRAIAAYQRGNMMLAWLNLKRTAKFHPISVMNKESLVIGLAKLVSKDRMEKLLTWKSALQSNLLHVRNG